MEKEFVPYEPALELKELGFDEPCFGLFTIDKTLLEKVTWMPNQTECETYFGGILAPLYQQAFRWFRVKHKLVHQITSLKYKGGVNFDYDIFSLVLPTDDELGDEDDVASDKSMETYDSLVEKDFRHDESESYEEAELACLRKLIEIVKNK